MPFIVKVHNGRAFTRTMGLLLIHGNRKVTLDITHLSSTSCLIQLARLVCLASLTAKSLTKTVQSPSTGSLDSGREKEAIPLATLTLCHWATRALEAS